MQQSFMSFIAHYGYAAVFLLIMLEDFGMPVPGETALVVSAAAAATGRLSIWGVLVAAFVGAVVGDNIGYLIGHFGGRPLVARVGTRIGVTPARLAHVEGFFGTYGERIIVGARFVELLRQLNGIVAGFLGMHWARFIAYNAVGAALWVGVWGSIGYFAGEHIPQIHAVVARFTWLVALVALGALVVAYVVYRRRSAAPPASAD
jgi:membrane protein DedA with SNARE-associated domain